MPTTLITHETSLGTLTLAASDAGLTRVAFGRHHRSATAPSAAARSRLDLARRELDAYLDGRLRTFTVPVDLGRTGAAHRAVLQALAGVGYGETATYGALAAAVGLVEDGPRQVGVAMARNPVLIVVPCHRVVGVGGKLTGYAGGLAAKRRLLDLEAADRDPQIGLALRLPGVPVWDRVDVDQELAVRSRNTLSPKAEHSSIAGTQDMSRAAYRPPGGACTARTGADVITLRPSFGVDLDNRSSPNWSVAAGGTGSGRDVAAGGSNENLYFTGDQVAVTGAPEYTTCARETGYSRDSIRRENLKPGDNICLRTDEDRYALITVVDATEQAFRFRAVTWEPVIPS